MVPPEARAAVKRQRMVRLEIIEAEPAELVPMGRVGICVSRRKVGHRNVNPRARHRDAMDFFHHGRHILEMLDDVERVDAGESV